MGFSFHRRDAERRVFVAVLPVLAAVLLAAASAGTTTGRTNGDGWPGSGSAALPVTVPAGILHPRQQYTNQAPAPVSIFAIILDR